MPLNVRRCSRRKARVLPGALDGFPWANGVGGRDPLASAVAGTADAPDHGIDLVSVAFSVGQPFEQECCTTLTHHKSVGALGVGTGPIWAERADLAELDKAGRPHVAIDTAGEHRVEMAGDQPLYRCLQRSQR